jgi:hypothetical protein
MRTDIYRRIVEQSRVELTPAEAWLLGRLTTLNTLEHTQPRITTPEEVAHLTANLIRRGYLTIDAENGQLELSDRGEQAQAALVEAGRAELTRIVADTDPPEAEVAPIMRRIAVSLLADIPRDAAHEPLASAVPAPASAA